MRKPCLAPCSYLRILAVLALAVSPRAARAQEEPAPAAETPEKKQQPAPPIVDAEPPQEGVPRKRSMPNYDGRGPRPSTTEEDLLWIPRVLVSPLYFFTEYIVRRPVGAILAGIEQQRLVQRAASIFGAGEGKHVGFVPIFAYDYNLLPHAGLYVWWDDAVVKDNHVRLHFSTWGPQYLDAALADRYDLGPRSTVALRSSFTRRRDYLFYGFGPESRTATESRYEAITVDVGPEYELEVRGGLRFGSSAGVRDTTFGEGTCCGSATLHSRVRDGQLPPPPRLAEGYTIVYDRANLTLDTRSHGKQTGVRLAVDGGPSSDLSRHPGASWLGYGASAGGFWDVTGTQRVLGLSVATLFTDPLEGGGGAIPFHEQVILGGSGLMRGFQTGRLVGRSAAALTLDYRWPVWSFLDGSIQAATGNAFGAGLRGFEAGKLRLSTTFALQANSSPDNRFEILTGFGTETFDEGARVTSFRLAIGATRGF